jgi:hypothetical protein
MVVEEQDGSRGGEYFRVRLPDGRMMAVSRKLNDHRVWLGREDDPSSWDHQRGGIGRIDKLLDEYLSRIALDAEARMLYFALRELDAARRRR